MKTYIGETRFLNGSKLGLNILGNHLPKDNEGYNPCLEIIFEDCKRAFEWYCKGVKIEVNEDCLREGSCDGFKEINYEDCVLTEISKEKIENEVSNYILKYESK